MANINMSVVDSCLDVLGFYVVVALEIERLGEYKNI